MARLEQEVRAQPRLHRAFYDTIARHPSLRRLAGRLKDRVRQGGSGPQHVPVFADDLDVEHARRAATAARLRLRDPS